MKGRKGYKAIARLLALSSLATFGMTAFACEKPENPTGDGKNVVVWTARGTQKILQETDYSSKHEEKTLKIPAFSTEYEAAQIIVTPNADVEEYTVTLSDLKNESGDTLSKDSFNVYHERYIEVEQVKDGTALTGGGWYPDALVPFEKIVAKDENKIEANCNQGVWVELFPSKDQPAGLYTGSFTVTVDGENYNVPVQARVYDYTLEDTAYAKSCFGASLANVVTTELDASTEMQEEYFEFLLDHRVTPYTFPGFTFQMYGLDLNVLEKYVDYVVKYFNHPKLTEYNLQYMQHWQTVEYMDTDGTWKTDSIPASDEQFTKTLLDMLVARSLEEGMDLLSKASTYYMFLDEYAEKSYGPRRANYTALATDRWYKEISHKYVVQWAKESGSFDELSAEDQAIADEVYNKIVGETKAQMDKAEEEKALYKILMEAGYNAVYNDSLTKEEKEAEWAKVHACFETLTEEQARVIDALYETLSEEKQAIVTSLRKIYNKMTGQSMDSMYAKTTYVPYYSIYESEQSREDDRETMCGWYGEDLELWWYGCMNPDPPYPTYHTEDELLSARLIGWMMYEYDITGNLYWTILTLTDEVQDYYETALRFPQANGDGHLVYPGRQYDIYGPVSSIRLKAILDGNEDYDLLYALENIYRERVEAKGGKYDGEGFADLMSLLSKNSYVGASCIFDQERNYLNDFDTMREITAGLLELASQAEVALEKFEIEKDKINVTLSAPSDVSITLNGSSVSGTETPVTVNGVQKNIKTYDVSIALDKEVNYFDLTAKKGDKSYGVKISLGGKASTYDLAATISATDINMREYGTAEKATLEGVEAWKLNFGKSSILNGATQMPFADVNVKALGISSDVTSLILEIYVEDETTISLGGSTNGMAYFNLAKEINLESGWNEVRINVDSKLVALRLTSLSEDTSIGFGRITVLR